MNSKEKTIILEVNIGGARFSLNVPFSRQDAVRTTEAEMKAYLKDLRGRHSGKNIAEYLAMMAYHYASNFFALSSQREKDIEEAEDLLEEASRLCEGIDGDTAEDAVTDEFDVY